MKIYFMDAILEEFYNKLDDNKQNVYSLIHNYMKDVGIPAIQSWVCNRYSKYVQEFIIEDILSEFEYELKGEGFGDIDYSLKSNSNNIKLKTDNFR